MSNVKATMYDGSTGEIRMGVEAPDKETVLLQETPEDTKIHWGEVYSHETYYFVNGAPVPRPTMQLTEVGNKDIVSDEVLMVRGIPIGCEVVHPGGSATINDGFITWSTKHTGEYLFEFKMFPYVEVKLYVRVR